MSVITPRDIIEDPDSFSEMIILSSGEQFLFRPLKTGDSALLADYFYSLSVDTRQRFGPHPFTTEEAEKICKEINSEEAIRLVATTGNIEQPEIVTYFILGFLFNDADKKRYHTYGITLDGNLDCSIAPSVADAYQDRGLGSLMMERTLALAQHLGRRQIILQGGVLATNSRAIHFYEKFGFRQVGSFLTTVENYDKILGLP